MAEIDREIARVREKARLFRDRVEWLGIFVARVRGMMLHARLTGLVSGDE